MSTMNGNPHYEDYQLDLENATPYDAQMMQLHATLALAFEQRTANLLKFLTWEPSGPMTTSAEHDLQRDIVARLGLNGDAS